MSILRTNKRLFAEVLSDVKHHVDVSLLTIDPVIEKHHTHRAKRVIRNSMSLITEFGMYAVSVLLIIGAILIKSIGSFSLLSEIESKAAVVQSLGATDISTFILSIRILFIGIAVLFVVLGLMIRKNRFLKIQFNDSTDELKQVKDHLQSSSEDLNLIDANYDVLKGGNEPSSSDN